MFLTFSEREWADKAGRRAGAQFDALYDSTPPVYIKHKGPQHCQNWRETYRKGWELGRRSRGAA